eukprot:9146749-Ditylum_brightwellii.AAC.1
MKMTIQMRKATLNKNKSMMTPKLEICVMLVPLNGKMTVTMKNMSTVQTILTSTYSIQVKLVY